MGNLSCVSCRAKEEKRLEKSVSELGLGDFKGAAFNDDVIRVADNEAGQKSGNEVQTGHVTETSVATDATIKSSVTFTEEIRKPLSLQEWRKLMGMGDAPMETEQLDPIEEAAKVIVDVTIFITTQIVYPAYVRYLQEDYPDVYTQYYGRPETPVPPSDLSSVDFESPSPDAEDRILEECSPDIDMAEIDSDHLLETDLQEDHPG